MLPHCLRPLAGLESGSRLLLYSVELSATDVIAVCAMVVAVVSLAVTVWQLGVTRSHNRLSMRPTLDY